MEGQRLYIEKIPSILWGSPASKVYLHVHGQGGNKEEAKDFAHMAVQNGCQVLSIDLPEHGERQKEAISFEPWNVVPELSRVIAYCKQHWENISLFANSIGAWFSILAFPNEPLRECLFVSPVVDMEKLISNMMTWANVSEEQLEREKIIPTNFGQTLSWRYWLYAKDHPIKNWKAPTKILYGEKDHLVDNSTIKQFADDFQCELTVMEGGEHWFHTPQQLDFLFDWVQKSFQVEK